MPEFNLLDQAGIAQVRKRKRLEPITEEGKRIAERLDFSFYDGKRQDGYGGYFYDGRWREVAKIAKERYGLTKDSNVLIDRCHKGFLVYDLKKLIPGIKVFGIHTKEYALNHAMEGYGRWALLNDIEKDKDSIIIEQSVKEEILPCLLKADAYDIPFKDKFFDCVISIENICAYPEQECRKALREIMRVSKNNGKNCYIQNDAWRNSKEKSKLMSWTYLCKTFLSVKGWEKMYKEEGYGGDWAFTIIQ